MRIHRLNFTDFHLPSALLGREPLPCWGLLVESEEGLVLVDAGFGLADVRDARARLAWPLRALLRPVLDEGWTAIRQLERRGFQGRDVRHILLTHLDSDHVGGISDFPEADIHLHAREWEGARMPRALPRFQPLHWAHGPRWTFHEGAGESWFGFESYPIMRGTDDIRLVSLPGHTMGHCGVALRDEEGWLLHAGDALFHSSEMARDARRCPPLLDTYQRLGAADSRAWEETQARLRSLLVNHGSEVRLIATHTGPVTG